MLALCVRERLPKAGPCMEPVAWRMRYRYTAGSKHPLEAPNPTECIVWCLPGERTSQCTRPLTREACGALVRNRSLCPVRYRTYSSGAGYR